MKYLMSFYTYSTAKVIESLMRGQKKSTITAFLIFFSYLCGKKIYKNKWYVIF